MNFDIPGWVFAIYGIIFATIGWATIELIVWFFKHLHFTWG
jgi:hypothetical protein